MTEKKASSCQECRRAGKKLFLKGERCLSPKCAIVKRNYPPGAHGPGSRTRLTPFGIQLREKQKMKQFYGLRERQFHNYFLKAIKKTGDTGEIFLSSLERRLDNVIYRMGFTHSRTQARQLVTHGHVLVNGGEVNTPSFQVRPNDLISLKEKSRRIPFLADMARADESLAQASLDWIQVNRGEWNAKVLSLPEKKDLDHVREEFDLKHIIEFYSK